ncbi:MAG TPA: transglutaminase family protein [Opitutaceae bacterium]|nr:transglutaminase family protein [Opitutaceae bacterium]
MRFQLTHLTHYVYATAASESFMEARLTPCTDERQRLISRTLLTTPSCNVHTYTDYFGNIVETFSIIHRHKALILKSQANVETLPFNPPAHAVEISVSEARQLYRREKLRLFEFLMPSAAIQLSPQTSRLANQFFKPGFAIGESLLRLTEWIYKNFRYQSGLTHIHTSVTEVFRLRAGVCQDFAQVMIAVLRSAEIPARYVVGYIETEGERKASELAAAAFGKTSKAAPSKLVGASESHAWVEVYLPGGFWWPLDPTNNCTVGERHVKVASGRDYQDCTPTHGVFKGAGTHKLKVAVVMKRN